MGLSSPSSAGLACPAVQVIIANRTRGKADELAAALGDGASSVSLDDVNAGTWIRLAVCSVGAEQMDYELACAGLPRFDLRPHGAIMLRQSKLGHCTVVSAGDIATSCLMCYCRVSHGRCVDEHDVSGHAPSRRRDAGCGICRGQL